MSPPSAVQYPPQTASETFTVPVVKQIKAASSSRLDGPLKYTGSLDQYKSLEITPVIGREYPTLQLSEILTDDAKIRDLAILGKSSETTL
jgi:hypothetical protein